LPVTVEEKFDSRTVSTGQNASAELRYNVRGTSDDAQARAALRDQTPISFDLYNDGVYLLIRDSLTVQPVGNDLWEGIVRYAVGPQPEDAVFAFDTGGGTQHITQSLATNRYAPAGQTAPNFQGAIGVTADGVEGVDITVPVYQFSETHYFANELITPAYKLALFALTGKVSSVGFRGLAVGECLFLGAAGAKRGLGDWEITYRFAGSPNVSGLVIGGITGISKKGWEYLWVRYADAQDTAAKALIKKPIAVYVEQVYPYADFSLLGIGL
jgi:hypothetical protein